MSEEKETRTGRFAHWLYNSRWYVIAGTIICTALLVIGAMKLRMNTSYRVWFNEGSERVHEYDKFRKRFAQDNVLLVAFERKNGILNSETITMIQRLTKVFWETKYVTRVDSLTNYSHTYVYTDKEGEDHMDVKDLIAKVPTHEELKALFTEYTSSDSPITLGVSPGAASSSDISRKRDDLVIDLLRDHLPYSKEKLTKYLRADDKSKLSKEEMVDLIASTLTLKLPMNRLELKDFIHRHIVVDPKTTEQLLDQFFPTAKEVKSFLLESGLKDESKGEELAQKVLKSKGNLNKLVAPYLAKQKESTTWGEVVGWVFPHLSRKQTSEQIVGDLRYFLDKLPPSHKKLVELITPYVTDKVIKEGPKKILLAALAKALPPHYTEEKLSEWLNSNQLTQESYTDLLTEVFTARLPLYEPEVKGFIKKYIKNDRLYDVLKPKLFYTTNELKEKGTIALNEKLVRDLLISKDGKTAQIIITPKLPDNAQKESLYFLSHINRILKKENERQKALGTEDKFHIAGLPQMVVAFSDYIEKDFKLMIPIMFGLILLTLLVLFRSGWGMISPILVVIFSIVGTAGLAGFIGYEVNNITSLVPQILMAIGIADSIHILSIFFRELRHGKSKKESMITSIKLNLLPCFLTSVTTSLGFLSLLSSISPPIRVLGVIIAIGSLLAFVITVTFLPALLTVLPFSKKVSHQKEQALAWTRSLGHFVIQRRTPILASISILTVVFTIFITTINVDNNPVNYFKKGTYFRDAMDFVDEKIKGANMIEVSIDSMKKDGVKDPRFLKKVGKLQEYLEKEPTFQVSHTNSLGDIIKTVNMRLNNDKKDYYTIPDDRLLLAEDLFLYTQSAPSGRNINNQVNGEMSKIRLTVRRPSTSSEEGLRVMAGMDDYIAKNMSEYKTQITGQMAIFNYIAPKMSRGMILGLIIAIGVITILLMITFKSVKMGLLSLIPNLVPLLLMFGLVGITGTDLNVGLSMVAVIALGIVVDDTIHFMTKYLRARKMGKSVVESVYQVFHDVGSAILFTSVVLSLGFGIFIFSSFGMNRDLGVFTAFTMVVALALDLLFLPALLLLRAKKSAIDSEKEIGERLYAND